MEEEQAWGRSAGGRPGRPPLGQERLAVL